MQKLHILKEEGRKKEKEVLPLIVVFFFPRINRNSYIWMLIFYRWGCPPSKFPWTYSAKETCYLLEGKVKVYPDGAEEPVEITAGDLVEFPKGMSCTWDVAVGVDKHYNFE